ncbi:regulator of nonsense transcripts 3B-like [Protopterus annectens]|uniref:regulator of nonsense transcripts 3B-like n=1 Tax=Protopterus annectens TaxID=7888 RepID=UPI001CF952A4|nr:regulator of nonsense transcripts 3B-like [Protopterus annectens]
MSSMKEDKENTKPRERKVDIKSEDRDRQDKVKEKKEVLTKVVVRRLPPTLTKDQLEEHFQPLAEHDYFEFFANDSSLYPNLFSRVYINFKNPDDVLLFRDRFDGYVFIDNKGMGLEVFLEKRSLGTFSPYISVKAISLLVLQVNIEHSDILTSDIMFRNYPI